MFKGGSICKLSDGTIINVGKTVRDSEGNTTNVVDWSKVPGVKYTPNKPSQNNRLRVGEIADSNVKLDKKIIQSSIFIQSSGKVVISGDCKFYHHSSNK